MLDMDIAIEQNLYKSGDSVEGELIITSDEDFKYNAIHLTFAGREHTRIVVSHGKSSSVHTDERVYFSQQMDLASEDQMTVEGLRYPFHFVFPDNLPSSYEGTNGWIEYTLTAIIERSWARDPKEQTVLQLRNQEVMPPSEFQRVSVEKDGYSIVDVEMEEDTFSLGSSIPLRFRVAQDVRIRGVRIEIQAEEEARTKYHNRRLTSSLVKEYFDEKMFERGLWVDADLKTDESMTPQFTKEILSNRISVKVTLDIPWAIDKSVFIPINLGYYALKSETDTSHAWEFKWD